MDQTDFLGFPIPVTLALIALVLGLLAIAWVLASLSKPAPLRIPREERRSDHVSPQEESCQY